MHKIQHTVLGKFGGVEIKEFCKTHNVKEIQNLDDLLELEFDLLFSAQYHLILRQEHINCAREIALNLHYHGELRR